MQLKAHEIHVWTADFTALPEFSKAALLSPEEYDRAQRFRFPVHKERFIAARSTLRHVLSRYLNIPAQAIKFAYTEHKKPYLVHPDNSHIQFNLSHSHDIGVYAFTLDQALGIDIEKMQTAYEPQIAERFFSAQENLQLKNLSGADKMLGFYRIWARKEALIKAVGKGLAISLASFSVATDDADEEIILEGEKWSVSSLSIHPHYQAALARQTTSNPIAIRYFNL